MSNRKAKTRDLITPAKQPDILEPVESHEFLVLLWKPNGENQMYTTFNSNGEQCMRTERNNHPEANGIEVRRIKSTETLNYAKR